MDYRVVSKMKLDSNYARYLINDIKDKNYTELDVEVYLNEYEIIQLISNIINKDINIDLFGYHNICYSFVDGKLIPEIDEDNELTVSEKKWIKKTLEKQYGKEIYKDLINPVITQKLILEDYEIEVVEESETIMKIVIPFDNFNIKTEICNTIFEID